MRRWLRDGRRLVRSNAIFFIVAVLAGVAGVASSYAVAGFTPSFIAGSIAGFLSRNMPDAAIRIAITTLGDLGHQLNFAMALGIGVGTLAVGIGGYVLGAQGGTRDTTVDTTQTVGEMGAVEMTASSLNDSHGIGPSPTRAARPAGSPGRSTRSVRHLGVTGRSAVANSVEPVSRFAYSGQRSSARASSCSATPSASQYSPPSRSTAPSRSRCARWAYASPGPWRM